MIDGLLTPIHSPQKKLVIEAVAESGGLVSAGEVAARTGLPVQGVTFELTRLASETDAHLVVSDAGDIAYKFSPQFQLAYLRRGSATFLRHIFRFIVNLTYTVVRLSVGLATVLIRFCTGLIFVLSIIALIAIMVLAAIAAIAAIFGGNDNGGGGGSGGDWNINFGDWIGWGSGGGNFDWIWFDNFLPREFYWWDLYSDTFYQGDSGWAISYDERSQRPRAQGNFLLNVFTFIFGVGNPNPRLEERKWALIGDAIRKNDGVMTAEQLAPYTCEDPKNEDRVLPVLVRFNGSPEVSDSGNIIYVFPDMQSKLLVAPLPEPNAAPGASQADDRGKLAALVQRFRNRQNVMATRKKPVLSVPEYLEEWRWKFSGLTQGELLPIILYAGFLFVGSYFLYAEMHNWEFLLRFRYLIDFLLGYASAICGIPIIRYCVNVFMNAGIDARNERRLSYANAVASPDRELQIKLREANDLRERAVADQVHDVVFTTETDSREQDEFVP